jgi:hypothetical protein
MNRNNRQHRRDAMVMDVVNNLIAHERFGEVIRRIVLEVVVSQDRLGRMRAVDALLGYCRDLDIEISIDHKNNKLIYGEGWQLIPREVRQALMQYRDDIYLKVSDYSRLNDRRLYRRNGQRH